MENTMTSTTDKVNALLDYMLETAQATEGFVVEQAPEVFQEVVMYGRVVHTATALALGVVLAVVAIAVILAARYAWKRLDISEKMKGGSGGIVTEDLLDFGFVVLIGAVFLTLPAIPIGFAVEAFADHSASAIKAHFAPRVYVIEWVQDRI